MNRTPDLLGDFGLWKVLVRNTVEHLVIGGHPKGRA